MVSVSRRSLLAVGAALPLLGRLDWAVAAPKPAKSDKVRLNYNESPYGPSTAAREAMQRGIATAGRYPYKHMYALAGLFAQQHGIAEEQVAVFAGSMAALRYAVLAFTSETRGLVMATPSYEVPRQAAESRKAPVREVDLNAEHAHDVPAMLAADPQAGVLYLCNPNNPTGTLTPTDAIRQALADKPKGSVLVVDEAYIDFGGETAISLVDKYPNLLVSQTLSKSRSLAGLRVGIAVGHPDLIEALERIKNSFNSYPLDRMAIAGAAAAFEDKAYFEQTCQRVIESREAVVAGLEKLGFEVLPSQANFVFARHPDKDAATLAAGLREQGVIVRHFKQQRIAQFLRITIGTPEQNQALLDALQGL